MQMHSIVFDVTNLAFSSYIKYTEREEREKFEAGERNKKLLQNFAAKCYGLGKV